MKKILTILVGFALASPAVSASSLLDGFTKDEAIDRITTYVPIKDNRPLAKVPFY